MSIDKTVFMAEGCRVAGENISIGRDSSVWYNTVIRCDETESVSIGERTNIQDLSMIHTAIGYPVRIGNNVSVGHMCIIHGCTIGDNTLIGMGSTIMNGAVVGSNCVIGAGSLVTEGKEIPDGSMAFGRPAKIVRELSQEQIEEFMGPAERYVKATQKAVCGASFKGSAMNSNDNDTEKSRIILEAMKERRSIRKFRPEMPEDEKIDQIIQAGLYAASGRDSQGPVIIAVKDRTFRDRLSKINQEIWNKMSSTWNKGQDPFYGAPLIFIVVANKRRQTYVYDGTLVLGNMMLAAHSVGLGSCWIHRAKEEFEMDEYKELLKSFGLEGDYEGVGHLAVGYIDGEVPPARPRKENRFFII